MEQNVLLSLSHVSKRFKTEQALKDINMTLHRGEILGFLGPSGGREDHHDQDHHRTATADLRGGQAPGHGLRQHRRVHL